MESSGMTTLQREVLVLVMLIASLATAIAVLLVVLWATWLRRSYPSYINVSGLLIDIVSVMVAFLPDGLPLAVTLSIARVAHTLSQHKVLCKSLVIVETLGAVNVLCSDKTGTLTRNKMHVVSVAVNDVEFEPEVFNAALADASPGAAANISQVVAVGGLCNSAIVGAGKEGGAERPIMGNETDVAVMQFSDAVVSIDSLRDQWMEVFKLNFNSKNKYMLKFFKAAALKAPAPMAAWDNFAPSDFLLVVKGAPEVLLPRCKFTLDPKGGEPISLSQNVIERITSVQEAWARDGQRVLLLARRVVREDKMPKHADPLSKEYGELVEALCEDLIIVGMVGLIDPLRPSIPDVVKTCGRAGIRFFIVTGDHPTTSVAIASRAGIVTDSGRIHRFVDLASSKSEALQSVVITGPELEQLERDQGERLCKYEEIVFARTTPEQKLRIVNEFKKRGCVVAMTGDGVNDAPSLKAADLEY